MIATTAERDALYRAILEEPEADAPRLVYADWLEENGDAADRTRSEFVRVQIELHRLGGCPEGVCRCDGGGGLCGSCRADRDWEKENKRLLELERMLWERQDDPGMAANFVIPNSQPRVGGDYIPQNDAASNTRLECYVWRRGFPDEVRLKLADFMTNAAAIFTAHPIARVALTDREPSRRISTNYFEWDGSENVYPQPQTRCVPRAILAFFPESDPGQPPPRSGRHYRTSGRAIEAMSVGFVAYGRSLRKAANP